MAPSLSVCSFSKLQFDICRSSEKTNSNVVSKNMFSKNTPDDSTIKCLHLIWVLQFEYILQGVLIMRISLDSIIGDVIRISPVSLFISELDSFNMVTKSIPII